MRSAPTRPISFISSCQGLFHRKISIREYLITNREYFKSLVGYHQTKYRNYWTFDETEDLVQILVMDILRRLGHVPAHHLHDRHVWQPDHTAGHTLDEYCYRSGTRAVQNAIKRRLKIHRGRDKNPAYPQQEIPFSAFIPIKRTGQIVADGLPPMIANQLVSTPVEPPIPAGWTEKLAMRFGSTATDEELAALDGIVSCIAGGATIDEIVHYSDQDPDRFGGLKGQQIRNLIRYVSSASWIKNRGPINQTVVMDMRVQPIQPAGLDPGYDRDMRRIEPELPPTPEQQEILALVPTIDRESKDVQDLIRSETIMALELEIGNLYERIVYDTLTLARALYYTKEFELWMLDDRYTSFKDFVCNATLTSGIIGRSNGYELAKAYKVCLELADENDSLSVEDIWQQIGSSKLTLIAVPDDDIKAELVKAALEGTSRSSLKDLKKQLESDAITEGEILDETPPDPLPDLAPDDLEPLPDQNSDGPDFIEIGPDDNPTSMSLSGTVPEGTDIRMMPRDKEGEHDSLRGMDIETASERAYFTYRVPGKRVEIAFSNEVQDGRLVGGVIQFNEVKRK